MRNALHASTQNRQNLRQRLRDGTVPSGAFRPHQNVSPNIDADDSASLYKQCLDAARSGNIALALDLITRACSADGAPVQYHRVKADLLRRSGRFDDAKRVLEQLVEQNPEDAASWGLLGDLLAERKEFGSSRRCYETAVRLDPTLLECTHNLATVLQFLGHAEEAEASYREVIRRAPLHVDAHLNLAVTLNGTGRYREALAIVRSVLARNPQTVKAHVIASAIEFNMGHYTNALKSIEKAIALAPGQIEFLTRRAGSLSRLGYNDLALADCDRVIEHVPNSVEAWRQKASVLRALGRTDQSLASLLKAESLSEDPRNLIADRAWLLAESGRKDEALRLLDETLAAQPDLAWALDCRAFLAPPKPGHPDLAAMEKIVDDGDAPMSDRMRLSLSVGRAYLDAGAGEKAFDYLNRGNALKRKTVEYDRPTEERWFADIMRLCPAEIMADLADDAAQSARPIFVFGMPRSGTTLVEQILASHPMVHGIGETPYLDTLARTSIFTGSSGLTRDDLSQCGNRYLELVAAHLPGSMRFVDKTNANFLYAGPISLMFPGARMIHCRRDPLDTCLSCYSLLFAEGNAFSYDLAELGHYYGLYRQMMAHWRKVLAPGTLLEIDYELLVDDTETEVRRLLDFCELPWDDACLRFYETKRLVTTSSHGQVRSPIYKARVGRARQFGPWLRALEEALENLPR